MLLLGLLPAPLHRVLYRVAHAVRSRLWRLRRPRLEGVRVLALDRQGRLLMVRHSYGTRCWMPPGGGLNRGEDPVLAGGRELLEETGCRLDQARRVTVSPETLHKAQNVVHIVCGLAVGSATPDMREIVDVQFFPLDALPDKLLRGHREALPQWVALYRNGQG